MELLLVSQVVYLDDDLLVDLFVLVGELALTVDVHEADVLVMAAESLAYISTLSLESGGVRSVESPGGTAVESMSLSADGATSSFSLGPFGVPALSPSLGSGLTIVWSANPYGGDVSDLMVTFTYWHAGRPVPMNNITPPLTFDIPQSESMMVESGRITSRRCVFWNTTTSSWSTEGVETRRKNLTHVSCTSSHATSFSVEWQRRACSFCATSIPATFFEVEVGVPAALWVTASCLSLLYLSCLLPLLLDRRDWKAAETNSDSYFRPHHRRRNQSGLLLRLFRKQQKQRVAPRRQFANMRLEDFPTAPSAKLQALSPSGSRRIYVAHPLIFRPGAPVVLNQGGATEERHVVSNFRPKALVIRGVLIHTHAPSEVVVQTGVVQDFSKEEEEEEEEKEDSFIDVLPSEVVSVDPVVGSLGTPLASACGPVSDIKGGASVVDCDAVLDAMQDVRLAVDSDAMLAADGDLMSRRGSDLPYCCVDPFDAVRSSRTSDQTYGAETCDFTFSNLEELDLEVAAVTASREGAVPGDVSPHAPAWDHLDMPDAGTGRDLGSKQLSALQHADVDDDADGGSTRKNLSQKSDADGASVKVAGQHPPRQIEETASIKVSCVPTLLPKGKAAAEAAGVVFVSLLHHLTPHWVSYSLHLRRIERYCLLVTAVLTAASWQCLVFVLGPGCQHEPTPAVCQSSGSFTDWDRISQSLCSSALSCTTTFGIFMCFNRPFVYGPRTPQERQRILRRRATLWRVALVVVVVVHVLCILVVVRTAQFFESVLLWRWVRGLVLSTMTLTLSSPVVRAVSFFRVVAGHAATHGRRTL